MVDDITGMFPCTITMGGTLSVLEREGTMVIVTMTTVTMTIGREACVMSGVGVV